jgi:hypothetical protein
MAKILSYPNFLYENQQGNEIVDSFINSLKDSTKAEESPRGSNKGPLVEPLQKNVSTKPGNPWCAAFIYDVLKGTKIPEKDKKNIPATASVKNHWDNSKGKKINAEEALKNPSLIKPGMCFFYLTRDKNGSYPGKGHTGIVLSVDVNNKKFTSAEGNTNPLDGSREGYGSFLVTRNLNDPSISNDKNEHPAKLLGFIDYFSEFRNLAGFNDYINKKTQEFIKSDIEPKTNKEKEYLSKNRKELDKYEQNYTNRNK